MKASRVVSFIVGTMIIPKIASAAGIGSVAAGIFGPGGIGFPIVTLMLLGIGSSMAKYLTSVTGGSWTEFIRATALFIGIGVLASAGWKALVAIAKILGLA